MFKKNKRVELDWAEYRCSTKPGLKWLKLQKFCPSPPLRTLNKNRSLGVFMGHEELGLGISTPHLSLDTQAYILTKPNMGLKCLPKRGPL